MCWYSRRPIGHDTLSKTLPRLCKSAGIQGYKTNHSLRATAATRLYRSGIDEQLVMERTGHRSLEGVRSYKRTSNQQREALSDVLNLEPRIDIPDTNTSDTLSSIPVGQPSPPVSASTSSSLVPGQLPQPATFNTQSNTSSVQANTKNILPGSFSFNSCSSITFNINYHN